MKQSKTIYLWEYAPSPHLGNVLKGMVKLGYRAQYMVHSKTYAHRQAEGWMPPEFPGVEVHQLGSVAEVSEVIERSSNEDIHVCVGLRANDYMREVNVALRTADRRFLLFMETISERNWLSLVKRLLYRALFWRNRRWLEGILATGASTPDWVAARGQCRASIFDFCYFLSPQKPKSAPLHTKEVFRLLFVGNLIKRKRVHLILEALAEMPAHVVLDVVGDGPLRAKLEVFADAHLPGRVTFHGARPMPEITCFMREANCLVLPSDHDGWGAVVSEAMIVGTPVVCSDRCGASVVVRASGRGHVFETFTPGACTEALMAQVTTGASDDAERAALADWATCLTEEDGAAYLDAIITHLRHGDPRPAPPWKSSGSLRNKQEITWHDQPAIGLD